LSGSAGAGAERGRARSAGAGQAQRGGGTSRAGAGAERGRARSAGAGQAQRGGGKGRAGAGLLPGSAEPLASRYDVALLDLDGVVYLGGHPIAGAAEALGKAAASGMRLAFVTNNASRTPSAIAAQLTGLGVQARADDIITSAQAAARLLAERLPPGSPVLVVGGIGLRVAVLERGFRPVSLASERPAAVVQGYTPSLTYGQLAEGALAVAAGAWYVASNVDSTLPTPRGRQPGNGALVQVIVTATGRSPVVAGKPEPPLHAEAVARSGARNPVVVGDRLDTDIESAVRSGADSLLVLTGVSRPLDVVLAPAGQRPTYLAEGLAGLLVPHPAVTDTGDGFQCGGWRARLGDHDGIVMSGSGAGMDGLRALCAAAWTAGDLSAEAAAAALAALDLTSVQGLPE
jgi:glycerol-1-phosphatase